MRKGIYRHYKGNLYEVLGVAKDSETLEDFVVYKPLYDSKDFPELDFWIRPIKNFSGEIFVNGEKIPRFEYIGNSKYEDI